MRHKIFSSKLGRRTAHRVDMIRNMVTSLIVHERIKTTVPKAKEARRWADRMVHLAKEKKAKSNISVQAFIRTKEALEKLHKVLVPRYQTIHGSVTRILQYGKRKGDKADMCIFELINNPLPLQYRVSRRDAILAKINEIKSQSPQEKKEQTTPSQKKSLEELD